MNADALKEKSRALACPFQRPGGSRPVGRQEETSGSLLLCRLDGLGLAGEVVGKALQRLNARVRDLSLRNLGQGPVRHAAIAGNRSLRGRLGAQVHHDVIVEGRCGMHGPQCIAIYGFAQ